MSQTTATARRGRFRFLYQFSLRTLLLATAAVAIFCNWYFQPKYREEELAGKDLRVRRQTKTVDPKAAPARVAGTLVPPTYDPNILNHGNWTLLDADNLTLVRGRFIEDEATGNWVAWYPTGGKAAEGKMQQGVKVGLWKTWYEDGTLASQISYSPQPVKRPDYDPDRTQPGGFGILGGNGGYDLAPLRSLASSRDGLCKAWRENGKLKFQGSFSQDQQDGVWTFYDPQGRTIATGPFRNGKRHGKWTIRSSRLPSGTSGDAVNRGDRSRPAGGTYQEQTVHYVDGRTAAELDSLLAQLKPLLASNHRGQSYAALLDLADLGEGAVPVLQERLANGDAHEQAAILGMLPQMPSGAEQLLPQLRELLASDNARVAHKARLTQFQLDRDSRERLLAPLLADATAATAVGRCLEELALLYRADETRRALIFAKIMELSLRRTDAHGRIIADAVADLGGDVTQHLLAACEHPDPAVRLQGITTLERFEHQWFHQERSYVRLDEHEKAALLGRLKKDPSAEVRRAAEAMERSPNQPPANWGNGSGFTGGTLF